MKMKIDAGRGGLAPQIGGIFFQGAPKKKIAAKTKLLT
jgi:hypothetical protein